MDLLAFDGGSCCMGNGQNMLRLSNDLQITTRTKEHEGKNIATFVFRLLQKLEYFIS